MASSSEITRVVTGKSTIPEFDTLSGTLTDNVLKPTVLDYTGGLTAEDVFGINLVKASEGNLWVYENTSTNGSVRRILSVYSTTDFTTWSIVLETAFATPLSSETLKIVKADLQDYSLVNSGATAGVYDNVAYAAGIIVNRDENSNRRGATRNREAKMINATGTSFFITENK